LNGRTGGAAQNVRGDVSWKVTYMKACTMWLLYTNLLWISELSHFYRCQHDRYWFL